MEFTLDVSIIIVNYNTRELIKNCIQSINTHTKNIKFEIIVSDNGSSDGSVEMIKNNFPQVILIENHENIGFGAANNRGGDVAKGKYLFYLNSDTLLLNNAVKYFFDYWEYAENKEQIGALGANLLDKNGRVIHSYGVFPNYKNEIKRLLKNNVAITINKLFSIFHIPNIHSKKINFERCVGNVDYVTGADLFIRNSEYARFDERFFLYYEETDLQWKLALNHFDRVIIAGPRIIHLEGGSNTVKKERLDRYISFSGQHILLSRLVWFKKNYYKKWPFYFLYSLTLLYLSHFLFELKTKEIRCKIKHVLYTDY